MNKEEIKTYDLVQKGYPRADHDEMIEREGGGEWCRVEDIKQLKSTQSDKEEKLSSFCKRANERYTDGNEFAPSFIKRVERLEDKFQPTQSDVVEFAEKREELAELCHQQWSGWMEYLFSKGTFNEDGTWAMPEWAVKRWFKQMKTIYSELSIEEADNDRKEADRFILLIN
ncbi:MAG TPA: hypothetical protein ENH82_04265 [bacterium]|nr:hypothetical protein [bacterium]